MTKKEQVRQTHHFIAQQIFFLAMDGHFGERGSAPHAVAWNTIMRHLKWAGFHTHEQRVKALSSHEE